MKILEASRQNMVYKGNKMEEEKKEIKEKVNTKKERSRVKTLTRKEPEKKLVVSLKRRAGRGRRGVITVRHRGGGAKRLYRLVDFKRNKYDMPAEVTALEYDPSRSAFIALVKYEDQEKSYVLAPQGLRVGQKVLSSKKKIKTALGNRMPLSGIPLGTVVHDVELVPGRGGQIVKSAGTGASILARDAGFTHLKMPSGEIRMIKSEAMATVGQVSNPEYGKRVIGKAGRKRHKGIRPTVRGKVMNPVDHPHGGGEGKQPIGLKYPKTPWGAPALGFRTRRKKPSDKFIIRRRSKR